MDDLDAARGKCPGCSQPFGHVASVRGRINADDVSHAALFEQPTKEQPD
jgi:hypothetical protein